MNLNLTPAAERALRAAAAWIDPDDPDALDGRRVLLGLLSEDECRAAQLLLAAGVDVSAVRARWPGLRPAGAPRPDMPHKLAPALLAALRLAGRRFDQPLETLEYATEHLLLGLAQGPGEVSQWLTSQGLCAESIAEQIERHYGVSHEPLPLDEAADAAPLSLPDNAAQPSPPSSEAAAPAVSERAVVVRILDAAANRAQEGLRVIEDYVRFALDDRFLTERLKSLRHDLLAALAGLPLTERLTQRDTLGDVGTTIATASELERRDLAHVVAANFSRLQESLRTLEEFGKQVDPALGSQCEALRYRTYTCQKALDATRLGWERLAPSRLYVLLDGRESLAAFVELAQSLVAAGVDVVQLRDKRLTDRELLERGRQLRLLTRGTRTLMVINDRADLALVLDADGVHVGQDELPVAEVRRIVGGRMLIGVSTHSLEQARQAVLDGANYIGVGPTFPSVTKSFPSYPGLELVRQVAAEIRLPAFAIGGIGPENIEQALQAGLSRVAVGAAVCAATEPGQAAAHLQQVLAAQG